MNTRVRLVLALLWLATACSSDGSVVVVDQASQSPDAGLDQTSVEPDQTGPADAADVGPDLTFDQDGSGPDAFVECQSPGCFGDPCQESADCQTGLCAPHLGKMVCSQFCVEECPAGWTCQPWGNGPDGTFACRSLHSHLCLPCADTGDCSPADASNVCLVYPGQGTFCGALCDAANPCPDGYGCQETLSTEGTVTSQCVDLDGVCECTDNAIALALSSPCATENEHGTCHGKRTCTANGLTACDAATPAPETCNGLDDDCDGDTDETACDDANPCTQDTCDPLTGCTHTPLDGVACDDGDKCTSADTCTAGTCAGTPVQCNDGNPCTDDLCDETTGCLFPANTAPCSDDDPCTLGDHCQDGECVPGTTIQCDDSNPCTDDLCDSESGCVHEANNDPCDDQNPCTLGDQCAAGKCAWTSLKTCDDSNPCTTDACSPSKGCTHINNAIPCDDEDLCTVGDHCGNGQCVPGEPLACDDSNPCTDDACNPLVGCTHTNNKAACDDLDPCTPNDVCSGGLCVGTGLISCDDANPCTDDFCQPMSGCSHTNNAAPCDDGSVCTTGDKCAGGACNPGPSVQCDDANPCTADSCDPAAGCTFTPTNAACDDHNDCTTDDHCANGQCVSSQAVACDDENPCTNDVCVPDGGCLFVPNTAACDDGDACTAGDKCADSACVPGPAVDCDDNNPCTADSCAAGVCLHEPLDQPCDDGNPCTQNDTCVAGACKGLAAVPCDDGNLCTTDYCDPASGCVFVLNKNPCDDGDLCTTKDTCNAGVCTGGPPLACNDNNPCTQDTCDPDVGCAFLPADLPCDDANPCTTGDHCQAGFCVFTAFADCDDGNLCTADSCDPLEGCQNSPVPDGLACDDDDACTTDDACLDGACQGGAPPVCDDGDACTDDSCDAVDGCLHAPITPCCGNNQVEAGEECDDGNTTPDDGCDESCQNESPCPAGTAYVKGYCWVKAISQNESHGAACSRIGKGQTSKEVSMTWNASTLTQVAAVWGYSNAGAYACCAQAMWCNNSTQQCGTHNWGNYYDNYGSYGDSSWWPVYTCQP